MRLLGWMDGMYLKGVYMAFCFYGNREVAFRSCVSGMMERVAGKAGCMELGRRVWLRRG